MRLESRGVSILRPNERDFPVPNGPHCGERQLSATMGSTASPHLVVLPGAHQRRLKVLTGIQLDRRSVQLDAQGLCDL
jgi:hypothetical protein